MLGIIYSHKYIHIGPYLCKLFMSLKGGKRFIVMLYRNLVRRQTCIWCVKSLKLDNLFNNGIERPFKTSCGKLVASQNEFWRMSVLKV
jgi:hypothetical protein